MLNYRLRTFRLLQRPARWWGLAILGGLLAVSPGRAGGGADEHAVKAAVLCNLPKFVEWPLRPGEPPLGPYVIGVLEPDPFGRVIDRLVASRGGGTQGLIVRRIRRPDEARGVHVLFIGKDARDVPEIRAQAGAAVLTVGETDRFLGDGGMVRLLVVDGKIRFEVNASAAARAGLKVSSQLLEMARAPAAHEGRVP